MIGRFNTDTDTDVSAQLFGAEIRNLRQKEVEEKSKGLLIAIKIIARQYKCSFLGSSSSLRRSGSYESSDVGVTTPLSERASSPSMGAVRDVKDKILASSKSIIGKVLSPTKEKLSFKQERVSGCLCFLTMSNANVVNLTGQVSHNLCASTTASAFDDSAPVDGSVWIR
jgi:hypothetical protein